MQAMRDLGMKARTAQHKTNYKLQKYIIPVVGGCHIPDQMLSRLLQQTGHKQLSSCQQHMYRVFCMVFHVRWIFLTTSLRIPVEYLLKRVVFRDKWYSHTCISYTSRHINHSAKLKIMKTMWDGIISQMFLTWKVISTWEIYNFYLSKISILE